MMIYNLYYRILDKKGRTKQVKRGGICRGDTRLEEVKNRILSENSTKNIAFDVYLLDVSHLMMSTKSGLVID